MIESSRGYILSNAVSHFKFQVTTTMFEALRVNTVQIWQYIHNFKNFRSLEAGMWSGPRPRNTWKDRESHANCQQKIFFKHGSEINNRSTEWEARGPVACHALYNATLLTCSRNWVMRIMGCAVSECPR